MRDIDMYRCTDGPSAFPNPDGAKEFGISVRTYIATAALQGILEMDAMGILPDPPWVAKQAVHYADALIDELNEHPHQGTQ